MAIKRKARAKNIQPAHLLDREIRSEAILRSESITRSVAQLTLAFVAIPVELKMPDILDRMRSGSDNRCIERNDAMCHLQTLALHGA
jgi:hypothetical protein